MRLGRIRVLDRRKDGSAVVEMPLAVAGDLAGQDARLEREELRQMVENLGRFGRPVPLARTPHVEKFAERRGPALGFVDSLRLEGDVLMGRLTIGPELASEMLDQHAWAGVSIEAASGASYLPRACDGWTLTGVITTNRPACALDLRVAAEDGTGRFFQFNVPLEIEAKGDDMAEDAKTVSLEVHEAKVGELQAEVATVRYAKEKAEKENLRLAAQVKSLTDELGEVRTAEASARTDKDIAQANANRNETQAKAAQAAVRALETKVAELQTGLRKAEAAQLGVGVTRIVTEAIEAGVPPAAFEGWDVDPAAWLTAKFASLGALETFTTALIKSGVAIKPGPAPTKSGHNPSTGDPKTLSAESRERLVRMGLNPDLASIKTEADFRAWQRAQATRQ